MKKFEVAELVELNLNETNCPGGYDWGWGWNWNYGNPWDCNWGKKKNDGKKKEDEDPSVPVIEVPTEDYNS